MAMFIENHTSIRLAIIITMLSIVFYKMYTTVIPHYISILEEHNGVLTMFLTGQLFSFSKKGDLHGMG